MKHVLAMAVVAACLGAPAWAATPAGGVPTPPAKSQTVPTPAPMPAPAPAMPMPDSVFDQAEAQQYGDFGYLVRPRTPGQIQVIWDDVNTEESVYVAPLCDDCTYKIRTREFMVSVIELPRGEKIEAVDLGDKVGFTVKARGAGRLAVRPVGHGYDTSLIVYGQSGRLYSFYLRAEGFNSDNPPDLVVRIEGAVALPENGDMAVAGVVDGSTSAAPAADTPATGVQKVGAAYAVAGMMDTAPGTPEGDFVADAGIDPNSLHGWGDYKLWGDDELKPETVFRDDRFTYIRFGKAWNTVELPTAYVVVDGIDELVNTRVQGQTYIIESTRPLITLKSGGTYLCIEYNGADR